MSLVLTARVFAERMDTMRSDDELRKIQRYFKSGEGQYGAGDTFMGVRMGHVFALAKEFVLLEPGEIELLLESPLHEMRAGAVSVMAKQAVLKKTSEARRQELFDLYLRRHDRINNWDLVDLGARDVLGRFLLDKPREVLYKLARSENLWERRSAMWATMAFLQRGEQDDMYAITSILLRDKEELIHKVVGGLLREAGKKDRLRLESFLAKHAAVMPRTMLRYAIEHFSKDERAHYLGLKDAQIHQLSDQAKL
jgi:3-methyladenine DNA glycosylase AlkD